MCFFFSARLVSPPPSVSCESAPLGKVVNTAAILVLLTSGETAVDPSGATALLPHEYCLTLQKLSVFQC